MKAQKAEDAGILNNAQSGVGIGGSGTTCRGNGKAMYLVGALLQTDWSRERKREKKLGRTKPGK